MKKGLPLNKRFHLYVTTTPTALLMVKFFMTIFALGAMVAPFIPAFGNTAFFPGVCDPLRAILGTLVFIYILCSIFVIPEKYCLFTIYLLSGIRISDALFGGPAIAAFLWFGAALICTYALYREQEIYVIIEKRIEAKVREKLKHDNSD